MRAFSTTVPGYPRVGEGRVYKKLLEAYWSGRIEPDEFERRMAAHREERLRTQAQAGIDLAPCGDFSLYDHVLDTAVMLGCVPERFGRPSGPIDLDLYFGLARGREDVAACEMTKWFDTNYHYLVPELPERFTLDMDRALEPYRFGRRVLGEAAKPVLLGPFTFLRLARLHGGALIRRLDELAPLYARILASLASEGAPLVQVDEPALAGDVAPEERDAFARCYQTLGPSGAPVLIQTYFGDVAPHYDMLAALPVAGLGLDFVRGREGNLATLRRRGFPAGKTLAAGVVDGRNVWATDLDAAFELLQELAGIAAPDRLLVSASCSLLHLPETVQAETHLPEALKAGLRFARERLAEIRLLGDAVRDGRGAVAADWEAARSARQRWLEDTGRERPAVRRRVNGLREADYCRPPYEQRKTLQAQALRLPLLPTTTIGSFPQTQALRRARAHAREKPDEYRAAVTAEIERVIRLQEEVGLDVLVHGEPERSDMVEFCAEQMQGFAVTREGWVQSYGSRCVRPPILFGDVERRGPMTLGEAQAAQSLTDRPVKGILTGPVTMLGWSFVREDIPQEQTAYQVALAIRDEAVDLERKVGLRIIQVDEPAFREGLPLRRSEWRDYLSWAVRAFRLATAGISPQVQVHTHMCYSEFGDILEAITALDADVLSIEDARSEGAMLRTLRDYRYPYGIGPGVYDVHSPAIPTVEFMADRIRAALACLPAERLWVNPDCGLKTRTYAEVAPALRNMVEAARRVRAELRVQPGFTTPEP